MKKLKNIIILMILLSTAVLVLSGCKEDSVKAKTSKSYEFNVETGDKIEIKMDTTGGYDLTSKLPIDFSIDDEVKSQGIFAKENTYDYYHDLAERDSNAKIIEEDSNDDIEYFYYEVGDDEFDYIIKIKNSKTCFILANKNDKKSAKDIFERLQFNVKK